VRSVFVRKRLTSIRSIRLLRREVRANVSKKIRFDLAEKRVRILTREGFPPQSANAQPGLQRQQPRLSQLRVLENKCEPLFRR